MNETPEQIAAREQAQRLYMLQIIAAQALPGIIAHYKPESSEGEIVARMTPEQIKEIAFTAYEIADATLQAITIGEAIPAEDFSAPEDATPDNNS